MHDRTTHGTLFNPFEHLQFRATSCTLRGALFHIVACILMHDRITYGTLFNPFGYSRFRATSCTLRGGVISYCSVHLDARKISPRLGMKCGGFCACFFVQQVARYGDSRDTRAIDFLSVVWVFEGNKMMWYSESGAPNRT